jgi:hypothetical protein
MKTHLTASMLPRLALLLMPLPSLGQCVTAVALVPLEAVCGNQASSSAGSSAGRGREGLHTALHELERPRPAGCWSRVPAEWRHVARHAPCLGRCTVLGQPAAPIRSAPRCISINDLACSRNLSCCSYPGAQGGHTGGRSAAPVHHVSPRALSGAWGRSGTCEADIALCGLAPPPTAPDIHLGLLEPVSTAHL